MDNARKALGILILAVPLLSACGTSAGTPVSLPPTTTPVPPTAEEATPTSGLAMGMPVVSREWEITITDVHQESGVSCLISTGASSSSAVAPYTYLVVDATLRPLDACDTTRAASNEGILLTADGTAIKAGGRGTEGNYCLNTVVTFGTESAGFVFLVKGEPLTPISLEQGLSPLRESPPVSLLVQSQGGLSPSQVGHSALVRSHRRTTGPLDRYSPQGSNPRRRSSERHH